MEPTTLQSSSHASPVLSTLFHQRITTFHFISIFPFIHNTGIGRIHHQSLLTLCLVCQTWKYSIDSFIHPSIKAYSCNYHVSQLTLVPSSSRRFNYYMDPNSISWIAFQVNLYTDDRSLLRYKQEYNNVVITATPQSNPLLGHSLILTLNMDVEVWDYEEISRYVSFISLYIKQFWRQVHYSVY